MAAWQLQRWQLQRQQLLYWTDRNAFSVFSCTYNYWNVYAPVLWIRLFGEQCSHSISAFEIKNEWNSIQVIFAMHWNIIRREMFQRNLLCIFIGFYTSPTFSFIPAFIYTVNLLHTISIKRYKYRLLLFCLRILLQCRRNHYTSNEACLPPDGKGKHKISLFDFFSPFFDESEL